MATFVLRLDKAMPGTNKAQAKDNAYRGSKVSRGVEESTKRTFRNISRRSIAVEGENHRSGSQHASLVDFIVPGSIPFTYEIAQHHPFAYIPVEVGLLFDLCRSSINSQHHQFVYNHLESSCNT